MIEEPKEVAEMIDALNDLDDYEMQKRHGEAILKADERIYIPALKTIRPSARSNNEVLPKRSMNISMDQNTYDLLNDNIPVGPSIGYASPWLDVGARLLLGLITDDPGLIPSSAQELLELSTNPDYLWRGITHLGQAVEELRNK